MEKKGKKPAKKAVKKQEPQKRKRLNWRALIKLGEWLAIALLVVVAGVTALSALNIPQGIKIFTVQSGSMAPAIRAGSIVVVKPFSDYREGEVITFKAPEDRYRERPARTTTHRIWKVEGEGAGVSYTTKGDFNPSPDSVAVTPDLVLGKVVGKLPLLGYPVAFAKTVPGLILLIVVPATILIYSEALSIKKEVAKLREKK
jgi:signal peptidase